MVSEKNEPKGKITPLVQIGVDESGRTVIHAAKDLKVDRTLLARILEAWGAFYPKLVAEMPDPPHPSRDNDSKGPLGGHRDRHEHIGQGTIGLKGFRAVVNHLALTHLPAIMETPRKTDEDDRRNLATFRGLVVG